MADPTETAALHLRTFFQQVEGKAAERGLQTRIRSSNGPGKEAFLEIYEECLRKLSPDQTVRLDHFIALMSGAFRNHDAAARSARPR
jgi:hypothetical protein